MLSVTKEAFDPPVRAAFLFCWLIFADNFIIYFVICPFPPVVYRSWQLYIETPNCPLCIGVVYLYLVRFNGNEFCFKEPKYFQSKGTF